MNTRKTARQRKIRGEAFFQRLLTECGEQVSISELGRRHGIPTSTLHGWVKRLGIRRVGGAARAKPRMPPAPSGGTFLPVTVVQSLPAPVAPGFVVELRAGRSVRVPLRFDGEELGRLVTVLEGTSC